MVLSEDVDSLCDGGVVDSSCPGSNVDRLGARAVPMNAPGLCQDATMSMSVDTGTVLFAGPFIVSRFVHQSCTRDHWNEVQLGLVLLELVDPIEGQWRWDG